MNSIDFLGCLHAVGKLQAGFNHLPGGLFQLGSVINALGVHSEYRIVHLRYLLLLEVSRCRSRFRLVTHDCPDHHGRRIFRGEHLHRTRPALYLAVGSLLHVVGAQSLPGQGSGVQVRERIGLRLLGHPSPVGLISADGRRHGGRFYVVSPDVGRVKPDVGYRAHIERLLRQACNLGVEARDDCAHAVPVESLDTHFGGDPPAPSLCWCQ